MSSKRKERPRRRSLPIHRFSSNQLLGELRKEWLEQHPGEVRVTPKFSRHIVVAKTRALPPELPKDSLVALAIMSYLDTRLAMTPEIVAEMGAKTPALATDKAVFAQFIPDIEQASAQDIIDVSRGIGMARAALISTMDNSPILPRLQ